MSGAWINPPPVNINMLNATVTFYDYVLLRGSLPLSGGSCYLSTKAWRCSRRERGIQEWKRKSKGTRKRSWSHTIIYSVCVTSWVRTCVIEHGKAGPCFKIHTIVINTIIRPLRKWLPRYADSPSLPDEALFYY